MLVYFNNAPTTFQRAERLYRQVSGQLTVLLPWAEHHHVGSTAIAGCYTKGDLDIVVRVQRAHFFDAVHTLEQHFAANLKSDRNDEFAAFCNDQTEPELGIQLAVIGSSADRFLIWRDLLRAEPALRAQYDQLKLSFQGCSMSAYRVAKQAFIEAHLPAG